MPSSTKIEVAGISVDVYELTVSDIRAWLVHAGESDDLIGNMLFDDFSLSDIVLMTSITERKISKLTPSEIEMLKEGCKKVNPNFFALKTRKLPSVLNM